MKSSILNISTYIRIRMLKCKGWEAGRWQVQLLGIILTPSAISVPDCISILVVAQRIITIIYYYSVSTTVAEEDSRLSPAHEEQESTRLPSCPSYLLYFRNTF